MSDVQPKKKRGFASMSPERLREIARKGGQAAQKGSKAHRFTSEEAKAAGKKGGTSTAKRGNGHRFTSEEAKVAGSKGGQVPRQKQDEKGDPHGDTK